MEKFSISDREAFEDLSEKHRKEMLKTLSNQKIQRDKFKEQQTQEADNLGKDQEQNEKRFINRAHEEALKEDKARGDAIIETAVQQQKLERINGKDVTTSIEIAEKILGKEGILGSETVEKVFGVNLSPEEIPAIPFSIEDIKRAKELDQFLVLRINKTQSGEPLTVAKMGAYLTDKIGGEVFFYGQTENGEPYNHHNSGEVYNYDKNKIPDFGWALTSKKIITGSPHGESTYLEQTKLLSDHLKNKVFKDMDMPAQYGEAIEEFNNYLKENFKNKSDQEIKKLLQDRSKFVPEITNLKINQLTRHSLIEAMYDIAMVYLGETLPLKTRRDSGELSGDNFLMEGDTLTKDTSTGGISVFRVQTRCWEGRGGLFKINHEYLDEIRGFDGVSFTRRS